MRTIIILLAILAGAIVLIRGTQKKPKQEEENFSGLIDGASNIASSLTLLVFVIIGVIIVVALAMVKKASDNPDRVFEVASKGVDVYSKVKKA